LIKRNKVFPEQKNLIFIFREQLNNYNRLRQRRDNICRKNVDDVLEGAAHRNLIEIAVRCTLYLSFNSHSTNIWVRCTYSDKVNCFEVRVQKSWVLSNKANKDYAILLPVV
jgi:hypothetical protein